MPTIENIDKLNLVINGGFEDGDGNWTTDGTGLTVEADDEHQDAFSGGCLHVTFERGTTDADNGPGTLAQALPAEVVKTIVSRGLSFMIRVACDTPGAIFAFLSEDGGTTKQYGRGNGDGGPVAGYESVTADGFALTSQPESVVFGVEFRKSCQAYLDNATMVFGSAAADSQSCISSEVLAYLIGGSAGSAEGADYPASGREASEGVTPMTSYGARVTADPKPPTWQPGGTMPEMTSPQGAPLLPHPGVTVPMPPEPSTQPEPQPADAETPEQRQEREAREEQERQQRAVRERRTAPQTAPAPDADDPASPSEPTPKPPSGHGRSGRGAGTD